MIELPASLRPVDTTIRPVRPRAVQRSPVSAQAVQITSPYAKLAATIKFAMDRSAPATAFFGALAAGEADLIRVPLCTPNRARGTVPLVVQGSNNSLTVTAVLPITVKASPMTVKAEVVTIATSPSLPLVNGGAGFKRGQIISVLHNGHTCCYVVSQDQTDPTTVFVTSRLRTGAITSRVPATYDPPYLVGTLAEGTELNWNSANRFEVPQITVEEVR